MELVTSLWTRLRLKKWLLSWERLASRVRELSILFFNRIEEKRNLASHEFKLRCKIKEKALELSNNIKERWRQWSHCNWLKLGDKNTRFFHAMASSRASVNRIIAIEHEGQQISDPNQIQNAFLLNLKSILGTTNNIMNFDPTTLYSPETALSDLDRPLYWNWNPKRG